jgi:hypothetical protein
MIFAASSIPPAPAWCCRSDAPCPDDRRFIPQERLSVPAADPQPAAGARRLPALVPNQRRDDLPARRCGCRSVCCLFSSWACRVLSVNSCAYLGIDAGIPAAGGASSCCHRPAWSLNCCSTASPDKATSRHVARMPARARLHAGTAPTTAASMIAVDRCCRWSDVIKIDVDARRTQRPLRHPRRFTAQPADQAPGARELTIAS